MSVVDKNYNQSPERTFRINGFVQILATRPSPDERFKTIFVQGMNITIDAGVFQRDSIGNGTSVFTQNGDVIGSFSFSLKNTVDLYDKTADPLAAATFLEQTLSYWMAKIANFDPAILKFTETFVAPKTSIDEDAARIVFDGRIMTPQTVLSVDNAIEDVIVDGEITVLDSVQAFDTTP